MKPQITTLKLTKETKSRLEKLREHPRETADQLIRKILWILNTVRTDSPHAQEVLNRIDELRTRWLKPNKKQESKTEQKN